VITTAGNLPAKHVIHTVGPVYNDGSKGKDKLLASAYLNSLKLAPENQVTTIAFPNISTGIYHFPKEKAAAIAIKTVKDYLVDHNTLKQVIFVCFDDENYRIYKKLLGY
ncbi:MAG TPA: macro domain-containing protein, partial [Mucilaginibacter sp.]|nr:macro domain-containing protein [Mucilaginibacter sp.]